MKSLLKIEEETGANGRFRDALCHHLSHCQTVQTNGVETIWFTQELQHV